MGYEARERLENFSSHDDAWQASYTGLVSGIAHYHGGRPVLGWIQINVEFDWLNWLTSVEMSITDIKGSDFTVSNIIFPVIDGDCCNERKQNGMIAITLFELDRPDYYVKGDFIGPAHQAVHGAFSNGEVTGGFGALQIESVNRPPLESQ